jgi:exodeoxyribonuclease III
MLIATHNVNSLRARMGRVTAWLERVQPDVVCLQETKVTDDLFPREPLEALGYHIAIHGQKTYNGVAILSKTPLDDVVAGIADFEDPQARSLAATTAGLRVRCLYVPNGKEIPSDKYEYKKAWLDALLAETRASWDPAVPVVLTGDFNVTFDDRDLWDPDGSREAVFHSTPERERLQALVSWGLTDAFRLHNEDAGVYTWWDYRQARFRRGMGLRIDHFLISAPLVPRCVAVTVDRAERKGEKPSDHAPVIMELADA